MGFQGCSREPKGRFKESRGAPEEFQMVSEGILGLREAWEGSRVIRQFLGMLWGCFKQYQVSSRGSQERLKRFLGSQCCFRESDDV